MRVAESKFVPATSLRKLRSQTSWAHPLAVLLGGTALAISFGFVAVVQSATPAAAAACEGCIVVSAPTIGLNVTAEPGQQAVIDEEGGVAVYTPLTTGAAGGPGTVWLVGHRTTHGAVFNLVPSLAPGDAINLIDDVGAHQYVVSRLLIVSESDWQSQVNIHDTSRSLLIVQTSHPDSQLRYLIEAFGVGLVPLDPSPVVSDAAAPTPSTTGTTTAAAPAPVPAVSPEAPRRTKFGSIKSVL